MTYGIPFEGIDRLREESRQPQQTFIDDDLPWWKWRRK